MGNGAGSFATAVNYVTGSDCHAVIVADFDNDGLKDLATANYGTSNISVLLGNGNGTFGASYYYPAGINTLAINTADFNNDGQLDIVATNLGSSDVSVFLGLNYEVDLGSDITECGAANVLLDAGPQVGATYLWNTGATSQTINVTTSGTYSVTVKYNAGCVHSSVTDDILVTINPMPNLTTNLSGFTIESNQAGAAYQWIDCATNTEIIGAISQSYTATADGDYAVVVTNNGCSDTSSCVNIAGVGFEENSNSLLVFPNPSNGMFSIEISGTKGEIVDLKIVNAIGEVAYYSQATKEKFIVDLTGQARGVYFVLLTMNEKTLVKKIVVE